MRIPRSTTATNAAVVTCFITRVHIVLVLYTLCLKKWGTHITPHRPLTLANVDQCQYFNTCNSFTVVFLDELQKKMVLNLPPHLKCVDTPGEN